MLRPTTASSRLALLASILLGYVSAACAGATRTRHAEVVPTPVVAVMGCDRCSSDLMPPEVTRAIEHRIADLTSRGASCSTYGEVLERSYREGRISIRPFMWRVGSQLVSGEANAAGEMLLAREIDSLNVGVRTVADLMRTMEHEAVHIAFNISSGEEASEARVNAFVRECSASRVIDTTKGTQKTPRP